MPRAVRHDDADRDERERERCGRIDEELEARASNGEELPQRRCCREHEDGDDEKADECANHGRGSDELRGGVVVEQGSRELCRERGPNEKTESCERYEGREVRLSACAEFAKAVHEPSYAGLNARVDEPTAEAHQQGHDQSDRGEGSFGGERKRDEVRAFVALPCPSRIEQCDEYTCN